MDQMDRFAIDKCFPCSNYFHGIPFKQHVLQGLVLILYVPTVDRLGHQNIFCELSESNEIR